MGLYADADAGAGAKGYDRTAVNWRADGLNCPRPERQKGPRGRDAKSEVSTEAPQKGATFGLSPRRQPPMHTQRRGGLEARRAHTTGLDVLAGDVWPTRPAVLGHGCVQSMDGIENFNRA